MGIVCRDGMRLFGKKFPNKYPMYLADNKYQQRPVFGRFIVMFMTLLSSRLYGIYVIVQVFMFYRIIIKVQCIGKW